MSNIVRLRYNAANVWRVAGIELLPGLNVVNKSDFERISAHPMYKVRSNVGLVQVVEGRSPSLTAADVAEIYDVKKLRELAEGNDRRLANAAAKQLEKIDEAGKKGNEGNQGNAGNESNQE